MAKVLLLKSFTIYKKTPHCRGVFTFFQDKPLKIPIFSNLHMLPTRNFLQLIANF